MTEVDIAVVGGGPAGAATARGLAAAGREVMLLERSAEPHHKVCGEFLSPDTVAYLDQAGIDPRGLGAVAIDRVAVTTGSRSGVIALPFRALSLSRYRLDQAMIDRAVQAGAVLRRGVVVQAAEPMAQGWRLRCNDGTQLRCRSLVLATGKQPLRGLADQRDGSMVGLKMHLRLPEDISRALAGRVELFLLERGYSGLELVEDGVANLCLLLPGAVVARTGQGWPGLRDYLALASPPLVERLADGTALWQKPLAVVCPAGGHVLRESPASRPRLYPVGDRLAHIPPFAGDGLGIALSSAHLAAEHIRLGMPAEAYLADSRRLTLRAIRFAAVVARLAESKVGRAGIAQAAAHAPALVQAVARWTRLPSPETLRT